MVDLASIRNASFSLTPTGYNPEQVDRFLGELADNRQARELGRHKGPLLARQRSAPADELLRRKDIDEHRGRLVEDAVVVRLEPDPDLLPRHTFLLDDPGRQRAQLVRPYVGPA